MWPWSFPDCLRLGYTNPDPHTNRAGLVYLTDGVVKWYFRRHQADNDQETILRANIDQLVLTNQRLFFGFSDRADQIDFE